MEERTFTLDQSSFPDISAMMLLVVQALKSIGGSAAIAELDEKVTELEGVSEEEQSFMMPNDTGVPRLNYYLAWARTYLKRGGAIENSKRGVWSIIRDGAPIETYDDARKIYETVSEEDKQRAKLRRQQKLQVEAKPDPVEEPPQSENDDVSTEDANANLSWDARLLAVLRSMDPSAFERLAQRLLREAGFTKVEVRGKSGDGGIDGVGVLRVNLVSFQVYFQCKRYTGGVSAGEIRDFRGAMQGRADKGLFITTGHYTAQANEEATRDGATAIDLIDGGRLCELLKHNGLGVSTKLVEQVTVNAEWFGTI